MNGAPSIELPKPAGRYLSPTERCAAIRGLEMKVLALRVELDDARCQRRDDVADVARRLLIADRELHTAAEADMHLKGAGR